MAITNQVAPILDVEAFEEFLQNAVYSDTFTLWAAGSTNAYLGKLKANINLNKGVNLTGQKSQSRASYKCAME